MIIKFYKEKLIQANDSLNKHGVKFTFYVIHRRIVECRCSIGKDHDMVHVEPIVKIEYSTY